tara:strand:- start:431 stop:1318 length:888 start_codon:yes stop_codon:yes gene_type:complete
MTISSTAKSTSEPEKTNFFVRIVGFVAGGSLFASAATLFSVSGQYPNPGHQSIAALSTLLLGLAVLIASTIPWTNKPLRQMGTFLTLFFLVALLPIVRFVPFVYNTTYEQNLESLFPSFWVFSFSIPLLATIVGDLALTKRTRSFSVALPLIAVVAATLLLFFGSIIVDIMSAFAFVAIPHKTLFAYIACIGLGSLIVLAATMLTRGVNIAGIIILVLVGLCLEIGSVYFYDGISRYWTMSKIWAPYTFWVPFMAGTIPGGTALLIATSHFIAVQRKNAVLQSSQLITKEISDNY